MKWGEGTGTKMTSVPTLRAKTKSCTSGVGGQRPTLPLKGVKIKTLSFSKPVFYLLSNILDLFF